MLQGQRSRSGRPGNRRTNVLTEIASPTLTYRRESCVSSVQIHARTMDNIVYTYIRSGRKRELQRPENEQIISLSAVATHSRLALIGIR